MKLKSSLCLALVLFAAVAIAPCCAFEFDLGIGAYLMRAFKFLYEQTLGRLEGTFTVFVPAGYIGVVQEADETELSTVPADADPTFLFQCTLVEEVETETCYMEYSYYLPFAYEKLTEREIIQVTEETEEQFLGNAAEVQNWSENRNMMSGMKESLVCSLPTVSNATTEYKFSESMKTTFLYIRKFLTRSLVHGRSQLTTGYSTGYQFISVKFEELKEAVQSTQVMFTPSVSPEMSVASYISQFTDVSRLWLCEDMVENFGRNPTQLIVGLIVAAGSILLVKLVLYMKRRCVGKVQRTSGGPKQLRKIVLTGENIPPEQKKDQEVGEIISDAEPDIGGQPEMLGNPADKKPRRKRKLANEAVRKSVQDLKKLRLEPGEEREPERAPSEISIFTVTLPSSMGDTSEEEFPYVEDVRATPEEEFSREDGQEVEDQKKAVKSSGTTVASVVRMPEESNAGKNRDPRAVEYDSSSDMSDESGAEETTTTESNEEPEAQPGREVADIEDLRKAIGKMLKTGAKSLAHDRGCSIDKVTDSCNTDDDFDIFLPADLKLTTILRKGTGDNYDDDEKQLEVTPNPVIPALSGSSFCDKSIVKVGSCKWQRQASSDALICKRKTQETDLPRRSASSGIVKLPETAAGEIVRQPLEEKNPQESKAEIPSASFHISPRKQVQESGMTAIKAKQDEKLKLSKLEKIALHRKQIIDNKAKLTKGSEAGNSATHKPLFRPHSPRKAAVKDLVTFRRENDGNPLGLGDMGMSARDAITADKDDLRKKAAMARRVSSCTSQVSQVKVNKASLARDQFIQKKLQASKLELLPQPPNTSISVLSFAKVPDIKEGKKAQWLY